MSKSTDPDIKPEEKKPDPDIKPEEKKPYEVISPNLLDNGKFCKVGESVLLTPRQAEKLRAKKFIK